jgi:hypothetical protein
VTVTPSETLSNTIRLLFPLPSLFQLQTRFIARTVSVVSVDTAKLSIQKRRIVPIHWHLPKRSIDHHETNEGELRPGTFTEYACLLFAREDTGICGRSRILDQEDSVS